MWPCIVTYFFLIGPTDALISQIYFVKKIYMFRAVPLPIIKSFPLYIRHRYMSYRYDDNFQARPAEKCRVSWQNKFGKLVRLLVLLKKRRLTSFLYSFCAGRAENYFRVLMFCVYWFPNLTTTRTPCCKVLLEKLTVSQLVKKFPTFYGTRMFITVFKALATCPYPEPDQSSPCFPIPHLEEPF
jgi:hypothetical protein